MGVYQESGIADMVTSDTRAVSGVPHGAGPVTSDRGVKNLRRPLAPPRYRDTGMWEEHRF
jgi:hypothetical protein